MASIHVTELMQHLVTQGATDAFPGADGKDGFFLEIKFDDLEGKKTGTIDEDYRDEVITVDCAHGSVTILFDDEGQLKSIEICQANLQKYTPPQDVGSA